MMYGQMTAGSWIYIGTQGILQGTYETFAEAARQHFGGTLRGTVTLTAGLGGMGGAQPLAVTMNDGVCLVDRGRRGAGAAAARDRLRRPADPRPGRGARLGARAAAAARRGASIALVGNAAEIEPAWAAAGERFDLVTDQTSAHDALGGYVPAEIGARRRARAARARQPDEYQRRSRAAMADHVRAMLAFQRAGRGRLRLRQQPARPGARRPASTDAFDYPGFVPAFIRPQFCEGRGPFRWAALSGDPADIARTDQAVLELFPDDAGLRRWIEMAQARVPFQGLPARICWLGLRRAGAGRPRVQRARPDRRGRGPDRHRPRPPRRGLGRVAQPRDRGDADGSDAVADWPLLNALVNTAAGASWVSIHHGGGVGIGYSQHAGMVVVADGTDAGGPEARARADHGPGDGRPAPRRRRLRAGARGRRRARRPRPDGSGTHDRLTGR